MEARALLLSKKGIEESVGNFPNTYQGDVGELRKKNQGGNKGPKGDCPKFGKSSTGRASI